MAEILQQKRQLLFDNLNLIMRHRQEILNTPRYANIDVHYALRGGGAYVGSFTFRKQLVVAGKPVTVNLTLKSLLSIWVMAAFNLRWCSSASGNDLQSLKIGLIPLVSAFIAFHVDSAAVTAWV